MLTGWLVIINPKLINKITEYKEYSITEGSLINLSFGDLNWEKPPLSEDGRPVDHPRLTRPGFYLNYTTHDRTNYKHSCSNSYFIRYFSVSPTTCTRHCYSI